MTKYSIDAKNYLVRTLDSSGNIIVVSNSTDAYGSSGRPFITMKPAPCQGRPDRWAVIVLGMKVLFRNEAYAKEYFERARWNIEMESRLMAKTLCNDIEFFCNQKKSDELASDRPGSFKAAHAFAEVAEMIDSLRRMMLK